MSICINDCNFIVEDQRGNQQRCKYWKEFKAEGTLRTFSKTKQTGVAQLTEKNIVVDIGNIIIHVICKKTRLMDDSLAVMVDTNLPHHTDL